MLTPTRFNSSPLKIVVGQDESAQTYINEDQAAKFSNVIAAAVKGGFKEAQEHTITFPEEDPAMFKIFAGFIYSGSIHSFKPDDLTDNMDHERRRLASLWILGEKLQAPEFKDAVVDSLVERIKSTGKVPRDMHQEIYPNSMGSPGMRRLVVDVGAWVWNKEELESTERKEQWSEFFFDLAVRLQSLVGAKRPVAPWRTDAGPGCLYHDHGSKKACYKTMFE